MPTPPPRSDHRGGEYQRQGGRERPFLHADGLLIDVERHQDDAPAADQVCVMKAVAAAAKTSSQPATAPGSVIGRTTVKKMRKLARAQSFGRLHQVAVEPQQAVDDRQRHQGKLDLRQRDDQSAPTCTEAARANPKDPTTASRN